MFNLDGMVNRRKQMTVGELIVRLQEYDRDKQVKIWDNVAVDAYPIEDLESYFDRDVVLTWQERSNE